MPVPLSGTDHTGFVGSLLLIVRLAASAPIKVGANVMLIAQFKPSAREAPHVLAEIAKSPAGTVIPEIVSGAVPVLESVTTCGAVVVPISTEPKLTEVGETPATGAIPMPVKATDSVGLSGSLVVMESEAARAAPAFGVKVIVTVQLVLIAGAVGALRLALQVVAEIAKSAAFAPTIVFVMPTIVMLPLLDSVIDCGALVVFNIWLA